MIQESGIAGEAQASTPMLAWQGVREVRVLCLVGPAPRPDARPLQAELCELTRTLAAAGAPVPVSDIVFGDPKVLEPGIATLLVHASVETDRDQRLLAFNIRPFRPGGDQNAILFGAAPRAVRIPATGAGGAALKAALAAALADTLPWVQRR